MDARGRDGSLSGPPSIKRPWEEERAIAGGKRNEWHGALLPPIDSAPYHRLQQPRGAGNVESGLHSYHNQYTREFVEPEAKRPRYEVNNEYHATSAELAGSSLNGHRIHPRTGHTPYDTNQSIHRVRPSPPPPPPPPAPQAPLHLQSPRRPSLQQLQHQIGPVGTGWEPRPPSRDHAVQPSQGIHPSPEANRNSLCRRCKQLLTQPPEDADFPDANESIESVTQAAATALTQLAETLSSGISSDERLASLSPGQRKISEACPKEYPPISQRGLQHTLNWLLGRVHHVNSLANTLVQHSPSGSVRPLNKQYERNGDLPQAHKSEMMRRRLESETDQPYGLRAEAPDPALDVKLQSNPRDRQSVIGEQSSMKPRYNYGPSQQQDDPNQRTPSSSRTSIMNPPLVTIGRQLPSPPGRSIPSPTSISFPSPSSATYGSTSQPVNLPHPSSLQHSSINGYLPPIGSARPDPAMQAHSAALQHEVSVQKIAISTLQSEHDKLLAAYQRSQMRASTLEKKQNVSDAELISLSEERSRLQEQILELEKSIEELTKSREECRQAAVQEGKQYIEIVKKASQLEMIAAKERESWNATKLELEQKIESLKLTNEHRDGLGSTGVNTPNTSVSHEAERPLPAFEPLSSLKIETMSAPTSEPSLETLAKQPAEAYKVRVLNDEVERLRRRCHEMEAALHAVKDDNRSMEKLMDALGVARKTMLDRTNKALELSIEE
ncbi:hypothetical protein GLAREA_09247 [Glarea lozoyensis ATCC 20868]|uniref:Uncharacterized protein n=1 Tax=Glarea lozoyensis (strain ATCC 20868 / MF5171) TaxID=1116229 RepID=S3DIV0_GLAL2|nr:uncharacterized protein GLAREA_09247 [Glarea lozoyensis ATCC 20868]EPE37084.1 hypothetical protein GLAREA_09247 [Glarea lozoyensis ATCC 20868]